MATVRFLAKLAGVSIATVSRALAGDPHVLPATRERILALAQEYHYHPNRSMLNAMTGASQSIGFLLPHADDAFNARILSGVSQRAFKEAYHVILLETRSDLTRTCGAFSLLIEQRVAGILACSPCYELIPKEIMLALRSHSIPVVEVNCARFPYPVDMAKTDELLLLEAALHYLRGLGHQRIGYLGLPPSQDPGQRLETLCTVLKGHRMFLPSWICTTPEECGRFVENWKCADPRTRPTAILAWNDLYAFRLMQACHRQGVALPRELSIMGFGNFPLLEYAHPALTTIEQQPHLIGQTAFDLLLQRVDDDDTAPLPPRTVAVPIQLIARESCAPPT